MPLADKIQALRKKAGWSQEQLAEQIAVSRQAISKWEAGTAVPDTENVVLLSRLFNVSTDYLLFDDGEVMPLPGEAERHAQDENRRQGGIACLAVLAMGLMWGLVGCFGFQLFWVTVGAMTLQLAALAGFEIAYHKHKGRAEARALRTRLYKAAVWLVAYFPVRLLCLAALRFYPRPISMLAVEAVILALYVLCCMGVRRLLEKRAGV